MKDFISIAETSPDDLRHLLDVAQRLKKQHKETGRNDPLLDGKTLALIFEKPSLRTRVSFVVAMTHLGGTGILLRQEEVGLGTREPVADVARVLSGMCDGIMARTFEHDKVVQLAKHAAVPVINGLTDYNHPCQAMADLLTIKEHFGDLPGRTVAYIGDGNNVARSLAVACAKFGMDFSIATPPGYELDPIDIERTLRIAPKMKLNVSTDPIQAVAGADVVYTDTWVSMGQEEEKTQRVEEFKGYQVNDSLLAQAADGAMAMHCLPAYRGLEITDEVMEGPRSLVFPQAENRLHFQKGLLAVTMGNA